jgi:hypothetical protein
VSRGASCHSLRGLRWITHKAKLAPKLAQMAILTCTLMVDLKEAMISQIDSSQVGETPLPALALRMCASPSV